MKQRLFAHLAPAFALVLGLLTPHRLHGQVILHPNTIQGTVRFNNTNPAILDLLNPPGDEGMSSVFVQAYAQPPAAPLSAASDEIPAASRTSADYTLTVESSEDGIAYAVTPRAYMESTGQIYYFLSRTSAVVRSDSPPVTLDFEECVGVVEVYFVNSQGNPVEVQGGEMFTMSYQARRDAIPAGATQARLYLPADLPQTLAVTVSVGEDDALDRIRYSLTTNVTAICDEFTAIDMVIPETGQLGAIFGQVDMVGEFELSIDGRDEFNYPDSTAVIADLGPFGNRRWAIVPGSNFDTPSSGTYLLTNVVASSLDPASSGYSVHAEMYFRTNRQIQYFRSPALGWGANPPLAIEPGQTVDLTNLFVFQPGYLRGNIQLQGPTETTDHPSLLRGIYHPSDDDANGDGIPDAIGTYGIYWTSVGALGLDIAADGAQYTAANGYAYADFAGAFNDTSSAYEGSYELVLGGLNGELSLWNPTFLNLTFSSPSNADPEDYFSNILYITDRRDRNVTMGLENVELRDFAFCFSEVRVMFRSSGELFYSPDIRPSLGSFVGTDFKDEPADYEVYLGGIYGTPITPEEASDVGQVLMYLPQGTYRLFPSVVPIDSIYGRTGLQPIDLTVGCGQRLTIEECLRVEIPITGCATPGPISLPVLVHSCTNPVTEISYSLNGADPISACVDCGINPILNLELILEPGPNTLLVTARDDQGQESFLETPLLPDTEPPTLQCPADIEVDATLPCGALVFFSATATDNCDPEVDVTLDYTSGSVFPIGETIVTATATDRSGNTAQCAFPVRVQGDPMAFDPIVNTVAPAHISTIGGTRLTVLGENFQPTDEFRIGGLPLFDVIWISPSEIQGYAPPLDEGTHDLTIWRCELLAAERPAAIEAGALPVAQSIEPDFAYVEGGTTLMVHGLNFLPETLVRIGFPTADGTANLLRDTTVSEDGTTITGIVPPLPSDQITGPRAVIVEDARGQSILEAALTYRPRPADADTQTLALRRFQNDSETPAEARIVRGIPIALAGRVSVAGNTAEDRALTFMRRYRDLFRLSDPDAELVPTLSESGPLINVRLQQYYAGLCVMGGELSVMISGNHILDAVGGLLPSERLITAGLNLTPTLTAEDAVGVARAELGLPEGEAANPPQLAIFDRSLLQAAPSQPHLIWTVLLTESGFEFYIDAHTGEIIFRDALERTHGGGVEGFDLDLRDARNLFNPTNAPACYGSMQVLAAGDENGVGAGYLNDTNVTAAFRYLRDTFAFFHANFGWHSYDNQSSPLRVFVHSTVDNAQWSKGCRVISFRDGWMDYEVMVHELTHGIVASTSRLRYFLQSGALDESYADVMALLADRQTGETNWTLGENRIGTMGAVRDIPNNPVRFMGQFNPGDGTETMANDFGNVHSNSGIPNYAAYVKATRFRFPNGRVVVPLTEAKLLHLKFNALRSLTTDATFMAARTREITLATDWASRGDLGFTDDDVLIVRLAWADVGVGGELDSDADGIPNRDDNCPYTGNSNQNDMDGDNVGDVCDNCPNAANTSQSDLDDDKIGDACDPDMDNDGCPNVTDQHPTLANVKIGTYIGVNCSQSYGDVTAFEGGDHDGDLIRDCEDSDDDNDGIPDFGFDGIAGTADDDPCPAGPFSPSLEPGGCVSLRDCPVVPKDWFLTCAGGNCVEYYAKFTYAINPDPTRDVIFDRVQIVNESLYIAPNVGSSSLLSSRAIIVVGGRTALGGGTGGGISAALTEPTPTPTPVRVELWSHATATEPARLVAIIGEYDPADLQMGQMEYGHWLVFQPSTGEDLPSLATAWYPGGAPELALEDQDGDGMPDGWEIQYGLNPSDPTDADEDGDGDGLSNLDEFNAGTDPHLADFVIQIQSIERIEAEVRVTFPTVTGRYYQLERTLSLSPVDWRSTGEMIQGTGQPETALDAPEDSLSQAFYRIRLVPRP